MTTDRQWSRAGANERWPAELAADWASGRPWLVGCNFIPSTAANQLEMWQAETFDVTTIDRELNWAADLGFNALRVFQHDVAWTTDGSSFVSRIQRFLDLSARHGLSTAFVLFDDCWGPDPRPGPQGSPVPGVHNSRWVQSPGAATIAAHDSWGRLEDYLTAVIGALRTDERVLAWDVYNEPGNTGYGERSLPLLEAAFRWARAAQPMQPLTSGPWTVDALTGGWAMPPAITDVQLRSSDVISFHSYAAPDVTERMIVALEAEHESRPILCTEYLGRPLGSRFEDLLPLFKRRNVGCFNWGLVSGKTQTSLPWVSSPHDSEDVWFSDVLRPDGMPFDAAEIEVIRAHAGARPKRDMA